MKVHKTIVGCQIGVQPPGGEDRQHPSPTSLSTCLEVSERLKSFSRPRLHSSQASALTLPLLSHANMPTCFYDSPLCHWDTTQKRGTTELQHHPVWVRGVITGFSTVWRPAGGESVEASHTLDGSTGLERSHLPFSTVCWCWTSACFRTALHLYTGPKTPFNYNQQKPFRLETTC